MKNKLINQQKERCLVEGDVHFQGCFPPRLCGVPSPPLCLHHQRAEDAAPHTFLEDELGSLLEVLCFAWRLLTPLGTMLIPKRNRATVSWFCTQFCYFWGCFCSLHMVRRATHPADRGTGPSSVGTVSSWPQGTAHRVWRWRIQSWTAPPAGAGWQLRS